MTDWFSFPSTEDWTQLAPDFFWFVQVHRVFPHGLASQEGTIQKGSEVLSINGKSLKGATHSDALAILRQARDPRQAVIVTRRLALEATPDLNSSTDSAASASAASDISVECGKFSQLTGSPRGQRAFEHVICGPKGVRPTWSAARDVRLRV